MGAVHGAERVGDVKLRHIAERLCEIIAVFLFTDIEAEIFKQHDLAWPERRGLCLRVLADYVLCKNDLNAEEL